MPNHTRGGNMGDLLRYLYGSGKAQEHERPHLVYSTQPEPARDQKNGETLTQADVKPRGDYLEERRRLHEKAVKRWLNKNGENVAKNHPGAKRQNAHVLHAVLSAAGPKLTAEQKTRVIKTYGVKSLAALPDKQWRKVGRKYDIDPPERLADEKWAEVAARYAELMGWNGSEAYKQTLAQHPELLEAWKNVRGWEQRIERLNYGPLRVDAVNHGLSSGGIDHIHLVVDVVGEDGTVWDDALDHKRAHAAAAIIEREFGLRLVDGHQHDRGQRGHKKGELEHDKHQGRDVGELRRGRNGVEYIDKATARPQLGAKRLLERTMRACAVAADDELDFVKRLRHEGVEIEGVEYDRSRGRGRITGYKVRLAADENERWYGGGAVAKDLTLPALRAGGNWPRIEADQIAAWQDAATRSLTPPDSATFIEAETALAELRQRLTEVDVTDRVAWAHVARDASGILNALSLRTEPKPGPLADAAYVVAKSATINRTTGDRRRWLGRAASRSAAQALIAQSPARSSRELLHQVGSMVKQITQMHTLAAQEQRAGEIELKAYDTLKTWLNEQPIVLAPADSDWTDQAQDSDAGLDR
jgi:hypothetical protein